MQAAIIESGNGGPPMRWHAILAPTDFSERSKQAVRTAAYLAEQCGAQITLLHVVQLSAVNSYDAGLAVNEVLTSSRESMDELAEEIPAGVVKDKLVRLATQGTVQEIIEAARDVSADLIVVATHGYGLFKRVLLGGTSEYLVRHAPCPVLVVRPKAKPEPNGVPAEPPVSAAAPREKNLNPSGV